MGGLGKLCADADPEVSDSDPGKGSQVSSDGTLCSHPTAVPRYCNPKHRGPIVVYHRR